MRLAFFFMALLTLAVANVEAKRAITKVPAEGLVRGSFERGQYVAVNLPIPEEVIGRRLDAVILEFYVDVAPTELVGSEFVPSVEVYPLLEETRVNRSPVYSSVYPTSRPVRMGERQRVQVDIGDIVRGWIAQPSTNFGLIIGSFSGPILGDFDIRGDVLDGGHALQATFIYQNRFGQRTPGEQR